MPDADGERATRARTLLQSHVGVVLGLGASFVVAVRLITVADLNPVTALAILQNLGIGNVLIGTLVSVVQVVVVLVLLLALAAGRTGSPRPEWFTPSVLASLVLSLFLLPWDWLCLVLGWLVLDEILSRWLSSARHKWKGDAHNKFARARRWTRAAGDCLVAAYVVAALFGIQPWFAPEVVETGDGTKMVAFVLHEDAQGAVLLTEYDRRVIYERQPLSSRTVCQTVVSAFDRASVIRLLVKDDQYSRCPDRDARGYSR